MSDFELKLLSQLTDPSRVHEVWELGLRPQTFDNPQYRGVFNWIIEYWTTNRMELAPTPTILQTEFPTIQFEEDVVESTEWLVETIQRQYATAKAQTLMYEVASETYTDPTGSLKRLWREAYELSEVIAPRRGRSNMSNIEERRRRYQTDQENRAQGSVGLGLPEFDEWTGGINPGELLALAAYTKTGKTFLLVKAVVEALRQGHRPILFTLEQSIKEIEDRVDAFYSGVSYDRLSKRRLEMAEAQILAESQQRMVDLGHLPFIEKPPRGDRTVRDCVNRARQVGSDFLIIDQLSFMDAVGSWEDFKGKHGEIIFDLKDEIDREILGSIPCALAVQFNRKSTENEGGRGQLQNFANATEIEQTVDLAIGLSQTSEERANMSMRMSILGSRRCDKQDYLLAWHLRERTEISIREVIDQ